jgi:ferrous iron transport protein B
MEITVALAGNPNVGKSTLFNILTGMHQHVANWPGKTVERREGICRFEEHTLHIVDLPGTYSLTASSVEELIAREFIVRERPNVVLAIVDASSIERHLYLVAQLLELTSSVVIALNKMDLAEAKGYGIDVAGLEASLGVPVVPIVARKAQGIRELVERTIAVASGLEKLKPKQIRYGALEGAIKQIKSLLGEQAIDGYMPDWLALKLLEGDSEVERLLKEVLPEDVWRKIDKVRSENERAPMLIADARYAWIREALARNFRKPTRGVITVTDTLDHILAHPLVGLLIFIIVFACIFWLTFKLSEPFVGALDSFFNKLAEWLKEHLPFGSFAKGLFIDGALAGFSAVVSLLPVLIVFLLLMGLLEDSGYMARIAAVMDGLMHIFGLHGKAALPLVLAYGCNVVGIMGTRILENERDRILTILLNPLIPCSARLSVIAFFTAAFFPAHLRTPIMLLFLMLSLLSVFISGLLLSLLAVRGERTPLLIELPVYSIPNMRTVGMFVWHRVIAFLKRASVLIVCVSTLVWLLSNLPIGAPMHKTLLGMLGRLLHPFGELIGLDWRATAALITGFLAKENSLATLSVLYGSAGEGLIESLRNAMTPLQAFSFTLFQMLYIPCAASVVAIWIETRSVKWVALAIAYPFLLATILTASIYNLATLLIR